ncbi:TPA: type IV pili twitching motility protein PilT [Candidatus Collierbacteria bacterium]|uniref:Type IV pilus retraction protein PilT n=1 Tax=Candidatus Collierbacteria bacterium GW2011_GWA2_42_17 TaxID=1618378 RepID=A0A0G1C0G7_9BACT|nr:MAG: Type IV pilus retraction protein PilT [Candidatus Collierbacteria bacterium GW2011_GWB2_42_12]KKS43118.1 MAG: Type IV pilus retraction protein PilT [Candidatus Collierbacteria bacterium GW2011_GWA2_42_17]KKS63107.1 MAG: Type IV pilus retraction protein PilT [Candidatus Collierbacteria bacterium GW2011_GWE2_42_48]KKS63407.1 MAG: Type IV pilus retraction protein PilT [Candidatus Collierbacteria bacterium GW2011_GWD2_42_50]KKS63430.1 MAG: Type IV pilus retraction protein PilT [Candidatus C
MEKNDNVIQDLLIMAAEKNASDLHLMADSYPIFRFMGKLVLYEAAGLMSASVLLGYISNLMNQTQKEKFLKDLEIDFSVSVAGKARFRANAYYQKGSAAISLRFIPDKIPAIDELRLPGICHAFAKLKQGFVIVTGPTGSGKSTTVASVLDEINSTRTEHIVSIEDPVEFIHVNKKSIVSQRELGSDTRSWDNALKSVLRQDPNVIYIGEMRDAETMAAAMTMAETGHLVFATLHTNSASQTIERIVDSFPEEQQPQIVLQLSMVLEAVLAQRLVPTVDGKRAVATEILIATPAVRNNIREGKSFQIDNVIQTSGNLGMSLLEQSLSDLVNRSVVDKTVAMEYAIRPSVLDKLLGNK